MNPDESALPKVSPFVCSKCGGAITVRILNLSTAKVFCLNCNVEELYDSGRGDIGLDYIARLAASLGPSE